MSEKTFFDFLWKIENFAFCLQKHNEELESPTFSMDSLGKTQFYIGLYPRGWEDKNAIGIYLFKDHVSGPEITSLLFDISLLDYAGDTLKSETDIKSYFKRKDEEGYGSGKFILRKEVILKKANKFLPQGTLTVLCRVRQFNGKEVKEAGQCIARTHIGVEHRAFDWFIDGILNLTAEENKSITVDSPSITMRVFFKPDFFSDGPLRLQISQKCPDRSNFMVCKISLINEQGYTFLCVTDEHFFDKNTVDTLETVEQIWDFPLFTRKSYLLARNNFLLPSGIITLHCEYTISVGPVMERIESVTFGPPTLRMINSAMEEPRGVHSRDILPKFICSSLKNDLQNLHKNKKLCDVKLKIDSESFSAHKAILSARSPVFEAMFTCDMKENATGSVSISDLDAETGKQMLSFIYTDSVDDLEVETALKLYFAADKYQLESLKELCSSYLGDHLEQSNVCEVLILADLHKDHHLKGKVEEFIFLNESEIIRSEKWKELMKSNSELAAETFYHLHLKKT